MPISCQPDNEKKLHEDRLLYMSSHDSLTGTYNRYRFEQEIERIESAHLTGIGLVLVGINGLKLISDAFDREKEDETLISASRLLSEAFPESCDIFRIGGDEFAILAYDSTEDELMRECALFSKRCNKTQGDTPPICVSYGITYRANAEWHMQSLYKQAESRLYRSRLLESHNMYNQLIDWLKETLKIRNIETSTHMQRMENMVIAIGKKLGLPAGDFDRLVLLASMHDIGKAVIPESIINKSCSLTDEEWDIIKVHSEMGCRIAMTSRNFSCIANEIACHHERWDGSGYPNGYKGEQIPLLSRIISVVDAYDVMTHTRVYRDSIGHFEAIAELRHCAGIQFDPKVVKLFTDIFGSLSQEKMLAFLYSDSIKNNVSF